MRPLNEYHIDGKGVMPPKVDQYAQEYYDKKPFKVIIVLGIIFCGLTILTLFCYGAACFFLTLYGIITK